MSFELPDPLRDEDMPSTYAPCYPDCIEGPPTCACAERRIVELEAALRVYADPRHWAISRDDLNHRVVSWIGPGAEKSGMPDAMQTAREALRVAA